MKTTQLLFAFGLIAAANAMCPNSCSGNGKCGQFDKCECHQNWQGPDCSLRTCPFELAWVDVGTDTDDAHYYAECANKGVCDRKTGECKCFDGYEGKGCRRSTCPNDCSGHGTCEYIDELIEDVEHKRTKNYNAGQRIQSDYSVAATDSLNRVTGVTYDLWDHHKIQGCQCDKNWEGADCSERTCPRGDDPLTTQINGNYYSDYVMRQVLVLGSVDDSAKIAANDEFVLTFYDLYGGKWVTQEIVVDSSDDTTAARIQTALRDLPNRVMEGVQVYPTDDADTKFGSTIGTVTKDRTTVTTWGTSVCDLATTNQQCFVIEFADKPGSSGRQYLLEYDAAAMDATTKNGFQPTSAGSAAGAPGTVYEWLDNDATGDSLSLNDDYNNGYTQEAAVCSNRGLCDSSTGDCECFSGYRGLACQEQEALT
jgi:hypothetical protein